MADIAINHSWQELIPEVILLCIDRQTDSSGNSILAGKICAYHRELDLPNEDAIWLQSSVVTVVTIRVPVCTGVYHQTSHSKTQHSAYTIYLRYRFLTTPTAKRQYFHTYRNADKSLARPTSQCILFNGENISFDASLALYTNSTNIPPIAIINRIYETQNLLSL